MAGEIGRQAELEELLRQAEAAETVKQISGVVAELIRAELHSQSLALGQWPGLSHS